MDAAQRSQRGGPSPRVSLELVAAAAITTTLIVLGAPPLPVLVVAVALLAVRFGRLLFERTGVIRPSPDRESTLPRWTTDRRTALRLLGMLALFIGPLRLVPWQLRRIASEPALATDEAPTDGGPVAARLRQWGMIIDLRYCDGCQSVGTPPQCTIACIEGHLAPEPMEWIQVFEEDLSGAGSRFIPIPCQHCQNPPCVNVCPVAATFSSPEGLVLIDQERCIGCRICMASCPYDRRFFNWAEPPIPPEAVLAEYDLEVQVPAIKGTVMKCDFCPDMVRAGVLPYCAQACPHNAIYYGDFEEGIATNGRELVSTDLFLAGRNAFHLKEELGTQPRVHYIPGHGELVGRNPGRRGRLPTRWPWVEKTEGSRAWSR